MKRFESLGVALLGVMASQSHLAFGCDQAITGAIEGALSANWSTSTVPRNIAFVGSSRTPRSTSDANSYVVGHRSDASEIVGTKLFPGTLLDGTFIIVLNGPLEPNLQFQSTNGYANYATNETVDETAPTAANVASGSIQFHDGNSGCAKDSCGDYTFMRLEVPAAPTDDVATANDMYYAIYLGETDSEARTKVQPDYLTPVSSSIYVNVQNAWMDRNAWVSIATVDMAAHFSARSAPLQIHEGGGDGCSVSHRMRRFPFASAILGLAGVAWAFRKLRQRRKV